MVVTFAQPFDAVMQIAPSLSCLNVPSKAVSSTTLTTAAPSPPAAALPATRRLIIVAFGSFGMAHGTREFSRTVWLRRVEWVPAVDEMRNFVSDQVPLR